MGKARKHDRTAGRSAGSRSEEPSAARLADAALSKAAGRLLTALAPPRISARPDAFREDAIVVRGATGGITLGRGTHPVQALHELSSRGLVEAGGPAGSDHWAITESGRACLRRAQAGEESRFAAQHREVRRVALMEAGGERLAVNQNESPLAWLRRRRDRNGEPLIGAAAFEAGERLRRDLTFAGLLPSVTARWDGAVGGGSGATRDPASAADAVVAARQRVRQALDAVGGDLADLLIDLCGFLKGLELIERERRWPPRSGKVVLRLALGRLAEHYGLGNEARGSAAHGLRVWTAPA